VVSADRDLLTVLGLGFLLAGVVGATARLIFAPSREDQAKFKV
jgi:gas vesicle protein